MYKVDLWVWVDSKTITVTKKGYAYSIETEKNGATSRVAAEGEEEGTWGQVTLTAIAEALERFKASAEVTIHAENKWVLDMIEGSLDRWEKEGFRTRKGEPIKHEDLWRRIAEKKHALKLDVDYVGSGSRALLEHTIEWGKKEEI